MSHLLSLDAYRHAVRVRDLTDPAQGPHAMQLLVSDVVSALCTAWGASALLRRDNPVVPLEDNYDRLRYPADGVARDARYTRYVSERLVLRTQTSAMIPPLLASLDDTQLGDVLLACPGIVYRRDQIDRLHSGEPHQLDLWRLRRGPTLTPTDLREMIAQVVRAVLPGWEHRVSPAEHPYTEQGLQIDVLAEGVPIEIGECGLAHPELLSAAGVTDDVSGLAMGIGLDRVLMLRKGVPDIRLLRSDDQRVASQMRDLSPYRAVSRLPPVRRDLSLMVDSDVTAEELGDRVRQALGPDAESVEEIAIRSETPYDALPLAARARMGAAAGQKNVLLSVVLRHPTHTLTHAQANVLRDRVYAALHAGTRHEWAG
ncbi:MAG: hypothetical protein R3B13_16040 [Polyangiaceae bacterium]